MTDTQDWLPIETAPRDGTEVLISGGVCLYDAEAYPQGHPFAGVAIARWTGTDSWLRNGYGSEYDSEYWHKPTHWQPLPRPVHVGAAPSEHKPSFEDAQRIVEAAGFYLVAASEFEQTEEETRHADIREISHHHKEAIEDAIHKAEGGSDD